MDKSVCVSMVVRRVSAVHSPLHVVHKTRQLTWHNTHTPLREIASREAAICGIGSSFKAVRTAALLHEKVASVVMEADRS